MRTTRQPPPDEGGMLTSQKVFPKHFLKSVVFAVCSLFVLPEANAQSVLVRVVECKGAHSVVRLSGKGAKQATLISRRGNTQKSWRKVLRRSVQNGSGFYVDNRHITALATKSRSRKVTGKNIRINREFFKITRLVKLKPCRSTPEAPLENPPVSNTPIPTAPTPNTPPTLTPTPLPTIEPPTSQDFDPVVLPINVIDKGELLKPGAGGKVVRRCVLLDATKALPTHLHLGLYNIEDATFASLRFNEGAWFPISSRTVSLLEPWKTQGSLEGGNLYGEGRVALPGDALLPGTDPKKRSLCVSFRLNYTDGRINSFTVVKFGFRTAAGAVLTPLTPIVQDDPNRWERPSPQDPKVLQGKQLWFNQRLVNSPIDPSLMPEGVVCATCHMHNGRELKMLAFSSEAISARAQFHGVDKDGAEAIAAFIRSLPAHADGTEAIRPEVGPWVPLYQPGPDVSKRPVRDWYAGAGYESVLVEDAMALAALYPKGVDDETSARAEFDARDMPLAVTLPTAKMTWPDVPPLMANGLVPDDSSAGEKFRKIVAEGEDLKGYLSREGGAYALKELDNFDGIVWNIRQDLKKTWPDETFAPTTQEAMRFHALAKWRFLRGWEISQKIFERADKSYLHDIEPGRWTSNLALTTAPRFSLVNWGPDYTGAQEAPRVGKLHPVSEMGWMALDLVLNGKNSNQSAGRVNHEGSYRMESLQYIHQEINRRFPGYFLWTQRKMNDIYRDAPNLHITHFADSTKTLGYTRAETINFLFSFRKRYLQESTVVSLTEGRKIATHLAREYLANLKKYPRSEFSLHARSLTSIDLNADQCPFTAAANSSINQVICARQQLLALGLGRSVTDPFDVFIGSVAPTNITLPVNDRL